WMRTCSAGSSIESKRQRSTALAVSENTAKFTASSVHVAPSGYGLPSQIYEYFAVSLTLTSCTFIGTSDRSLHQRHQPTAAGDLELAEDGVEMLFHHLQAQAGIIGDLLVT